MKLLRPGPPWVLRTECSNCRSLLLVEEEDIELVSTPPASSREEREAMRNKPDYGVNQWTCPHCRRSTLIECIPEHVKTLARSKATWNVGQ